MSLFFCGCFNYNGGLFRRAYSLLRPILLLSSPRLREKRKQNKKKYVKFLPSRIFVSKREDVRLSVFR